MTLRRKFLICFGGLGMMILLVVGVSGWSIFQWKRTNTMLEEHYLRSLLLQSVRSAVFRSAKEIPDAVVGSDEDAPEEFLKLTAPVTRDFNQWAALAHTPSEEEQVETIRVAYEAIFKDANKVFEMAGRGARDEAMLFMEDVMENGSLERFDQLTEAAVVSDEAYRKIVQSEVQWVRDTDKIVLVIAAFGTISLILLLFAYLSNDLYIPLNALETALQMAKKGDYRHRLPEDRKDEIGRVHRAFNQMLESVLHREKIRSFLSGKEDTEKDPDWKNTPSKLVLHRTLFHMQEHLAQLQQTAVGKQVPEKAVLTTMTREIESLLDTVTRFSEFGFPLDLNLSKINIGALFYEVSQSFYESFSERGVGFEVDIANDLPAFLGDRLKLRAVLAELFHNALRALPLRGGHIGLRAALVREKSVLKIEIADDGKGFDVQSVDDLLLRPEKETSLPDSGLVFAREIVEQHGGEIAVYSERKKGTCVQLLFPVMS